MKVGASRGNNRVISSRAPVTESSSEPLKLQTQSLRLRSPHKKHVEWVQNRLKVEADGLFGAKTRTAVQAFQKENGLKSDGVVGDATLKLLNKGLDADQQLELPALSLKQGQRDRGGQKRINKLQNLLKKQGLELEADGVFGRQTRAAVTSFQKQNDIEANGQVGRETLAAFQGKAKPKTEVPKPAKGGVSDPKKPTEKKKPAQSALSSLNMKERLRLMDLGEKPIPVSPETKKKLPGAIKTLEKLAGKDGVWDTKDRARNLVQLEGAIKQRAHEEIDKRYDAKVEEAAKESYLPGVVRLAGWWHRDSVHEEHGEKAVKEGRSQALQQLNKTMTKMGLSPTEKLDPKAVEKANQNASKLPKISADEIAQFQSVMKDLEAQGKKLGIPTGGVGKGLSPDLLKDIQAGKPAGMVLLKAAEPENFDKLSKPLPLTSNERQEVSKALGTLKKLAGEDQVWDRSDLKKNVQQMEPELRQEVRRRINGEFDKRFDKEFNKRFNREFSRRYNREAGKRIRREINRRIKKNPLIGLYAALGGRKKMEKIGWQEAARQRRGHYRRQRAKYYPKEKVKARKAAHRKHTAGGMRKANDLAFKELQSGMDRLGVKVGKASTSWQGKAPTLTSSELNQLRSVLTLLEGKAKELGVGGGPTGFSQGLPTRFLEHVYQQKPIGLTGILTQG